MSDPVETSLAAQIKTVLVNNGVDIDGGSFHSWRCFDKERYPEPCTCTDEVVAEIMEAVAAAVQAERERIRAGVDALEGWQPPNMGSDLVSRQDVHRVVLYPVIDGGSDE